MNAAANITPVIAAVVAKARRKILAYFRVHHAISAAEAVPYAPGHGVAERQFRHLLERGILRETAGGLYWYDIATHQAHRERTRRMLVPIVIALTVIAAGLLLLLYRG